MKQEDFNNYIAVALRGAREKAGVSQTKIAELLGVKQSSVAGFESGSGAVSTETIRKYGEALGLDVELSFIKRKRKAAKEKAISEPFIEAGEECGECDGTGWCEGSKGVIKSTCKKCQGKGVLEIVSAVAKTS